MKHVKPVSKAMIAPLTSLLDLLELLVTLGVVNISDLFKKNGTAG